MRFVERLEQSETFGPQIVWHEKIPARPAEYGEPSGPVGPVVHRILQGMGIDRLYVHQARAMDLVRAGRHVITATPTASGKTLVYNLPVFEAVERDPEIRALYLFPLKALARDQLKAIETLNGLAAPVRVRADVYDGDTSDHRRRKIRQKPPHVLITNPDMLHLSILAYHRTWAEFFARLSFVIIDEVHTYRGVFGSHMAQILRRLHRVLARYGGRPTFVLSSATIGNPDRFARALTGLNCEAVTQSGAPTSGKHFLFVNPDAGPAVAAARIFARAIQDGLRTIAFTQARKLTELMHRWVAQMVPALSGKLSSYRAGFLPEERREIERKLGTGELLGVISTSALEMGLDIGALEVCLLVGYPGSIINTWQRSGRVGRSDRESVVILLAQPDALDQYFMTHPDKFFTRDFEPAVLDPDNEPITGAHMACAAAELPLAADDPFFRPRERPALMADLLSRGELFLDAEGRTYFPGQRGAHRRVDIRGTGGTFTILAQATGEVIGGADSHRVFRECHPGAIYLHRGRTWVVEHLDHEKGNVLVRPAVVDYFTRPHMEKETEILEVLAVKPVANFLAKLGRLRVREQVVAYEKRHIRGQELLGLFPLDLPEMVFETVGLWFELEDFIPEALEPAHHYMGGIHALEHAAIGLFPLAALCDRNDVGGISYPLHPELGKGAVFIYDGYPGGVGLTRTGYEVIEDLLNQTLAAIESCECEEGCPSCIYSPKCGSGNKPLDKAAAVRIIELLLGRRPPPSAGERKSESGKPGPAIRTRLPDKRLVVFDLETRRSADDVGGWTRSHLMGLAVGVVYEALEDTYYAYDEGRVGELVERLLSADLVIGFNQLHFDYQVLSAYTPRDLRGRPNLDLLEEIYKSLGRRVGLGHLGEVTLGRDKTADGLQSLQWVKEGRMDLVEAYCREDVRLTWDLFVFARDNGYLLFEDKKKKRRIPLDLDPARFMAGAGDAGK
ncbi:MAG: DEAD/DEAH box helicase [Proteobacteria bacterium]|nr:DEAD/DEAH box helicase [Pseudomonadota bacterium]